MQDTRNQFERIIPIKQLQMQHTQLVHLSHVDGCISVADEPVSIAGFDKPACAAGHGGLCKARELNGTHLVTV